VAANWRVTGRAPGRGWCVNCDGNGAGPSHIETDDEQQARDQIRAEKGFYQHAMRYVLVIGLLFAINRLSGAGYLWAVWPMSGWGTGLLIHSGSVLIRTDHLFGDASWPNALGGQNSQKIDSIGAQH